VAGQCTPGNLNALTTLDLPLLVYVGSAFTADVMPSLTTLNIPELAYVGGVFSPGHDAALTTLDAPSLVYVGNGFSPDVMPLTTLNVPELAFVGSNFQPNNLSSLTTLSLPALAIVGGIFNPNNMAALTTVTLPAIVSIGGGEGGGSGGIDLSDGAETALTTFTLGAGLKYVGGDVLFPSSALDQASVDNILERLAALDGTGGTTIYSGHTVTLTGTAATPSGGGLAAAATLTGRGCTVTHN
jgi:hypothetical protein